MLLEDLIKEYQYELQIQNLSKHTIKSYMSVLNNLFIVLEKDNITNIEEIGDIHIKQYILFMKNKCMKESSINTNLKVILTFFNYCLEEGYINKVPRCKKMKEPKNLIEIFTDDEINKLFNYYSYNNFLEARNKCIIAILLDCGIRCNELCKIKTIDVRETSVLICGKGNKERLVPISPMLKKIMIKYERIRNNYMSRRMITSDSYFPSRAGKQLTNESVQRMIKSTCRACDIKESISHPHSFRHTCATKMLMNGLDIYLVSKILGHSSLSITKRYLQISDIEVMEMSVNSSILMNQVK